MKRLEDRLEKLYLDKLDETITEDEYKRLSNKFRSELRYQVSAGAITTGKR